MILLHIGTDKTGSTAIQKLISFNKNIFNNLGFNYPYDIKGYNQSIMMDFIKKEILKEKLSSIDFSKNTILSFEGFYGLEENKIRYFISELRKYDKDIKVLIYLRRQDSKLESGLLQNIKMGDIKRLKNFKIEYIPTLDYYKIIKKWEKYVGKENIIIRPYDKKFFPKNDSLIKDFFQKGLNLDYEKIKAKLTIPKSDPNPSLDALSGMVIDFFANIIKDDIKWSLIYQLLGIQEKYGKSSKTLFNKIERKKILELYEYNNKKIIEEFNIPIELFKLDNKIYAKPSENEIMERIKILYKLKDILLPLKEWEGKGNFIENIKNNKILLKKGFYHIEKWGVWSKGNIEGKIYFLIFRGYINGIDKIKLNVTVRYSNNFTKSYVKIYNNNWQILKNGTNVYKINTKEIRENGGIVLLNFKHINAKSPKEIGKNNDTRILGVGIENINFEAII